MRIISGRFKGRKLIAPKKIRARPTTDFAKESLFNILHSQIDWKSTHFLDLFAGIGSITIEAASRGVQHVTSIDNNPTAVKWIHSTLVDLDFLEHTVIKSDALKWISSNKEVFPLVFADPPYEYDYYETLIESVLKKCLMNGGLFILEHRRNISFEEHANFAEDRKYGEVKFTFFRIE
ncbi:MAG: 16S rRNA (guanine(966)-N(2))-methyltransferase RsmD [Salibacteraceae bacterium]